MEETLRTWNRDARAISRSKLGSKLPSCYSTANGLPHAQCSSWSTLEHMRRSFVTSSAKRPKVPRCEQTLPLKGNGETHKQRLNTCAGAEFAQ